MKLKDLNSFNDIVIQCHDNPDADALASGYGLYVYFSKLGKKVRFIYRGKNKIRKSNLLIMLHKLSVPVEYAPDFDEVPELLITVDCQYGQKNVSSINAQNIAIIDHHQKTVDTPALSEIRSNVGSASTVVWDMIRKEGSEYEKLISDNSKLSTALYYGLFTDTGKLSEVSHPLDRDMLDALSINKSIIMEMSNSNISLNELKITGKAILGNEFFSKNRYLIIKSEPCDPNILGVMSDFSLETAGVDTTLTYYETDAEIKFSVRSCSKEVHAKERAALLADGIGGGGGHMYKAGGVIRPEKITGISTDALLKKRMASYFDSFDIIYASKYDMDLSDMKKYTKLSQKKGVVKLTEIFPENSFVSIRTLEGDIDTRVEEDLYVIIGVEGEIYPIKEKKLLQSYHLTDEPYQNEQEYPPQVLNISTGEKKEIMKYAKEIDSCDSSNIYAKKLSRGVKVFTAWDNEKYYLGNVGDYIAVREDDLHDIYVIKGRLFDQLYQTAN